MLRKTHNPQVILQLLILVITVTLLLLISGIIVVQLNMPIKETIPILLGCAITILTAMAILYIVLDVMYHEPRGHSLNGYYKQK